MQEYTHPSTGTYYRKNTFNSEKTTLVFIHGLSGSLSAWRDYESGFEEKYNILEIDLRGHGKSRKYRDYPSYDFNLFAEDILLLFAYLEIKSCIPIGHSFGTLVALEMLRSKPEMMSKAVFISPIFYARKTFLARLVSPFLALSFFMLNLFPFNAKSGHHVDYSSFHATADWDIRRMYIDIKNTTLRVYIACLNHLYSYDSEKYLQNLSLPILIIHGKKDSIISLQNSRRLVSMLPHSKLAVIESGNHILVLNNISELSKVISDFIGNM
jgi:pimeloyl-ACP methyl ester carboxylesterase